MDWPAWIEAVAAAVSAGAAVWLACTSTGNVEALASVQPPTWAGSAGERLPPG